MSERAAISRAEWRRVLVLAAVVMALTSVPYVLGWLNQGDAWGFGGFLFGADDGYSYLAKMRIGARGDWLFTIRYTSEPHDGALLFLPYIALGQLTGLFVSSTDPSLSVALAVVYHIARVVGGLLLFVVSYRFVAYFLRGPGSRMLALILTTLGGGLGWLLAIVGLGDWLGSLPVDFYVPEGYSFLILFGLPHLALARSALLAGFLLLFRALELPGGGGAWWRWTTAAGLCWVVMGLCVPFYVAVLYLILGVWGLAAWWRGGRFPWALFWRATSAAVVALPVLAYTAVVFLANDVLGEWSGQNQLPSPHVLHYVFGYVALAIPAVAGWRWVWRAGGPDARAPYVLLAAWVIMAPLVVYLPINVQRRLAEGVIVPLGILAAAGLRLWFPRPRAYRRARALVLGLTLPTALLLWLGGMATTFAPDRPLFRPAAELDALDTLDRMAPADSVVLSAKPTGNVIPARTNLIAYVGHGPETVHSEEKAGWAESFFAGTLDAPTVDAMLDAVDYVWYGPVEQDESETPAWDLTTRYARLVPIYAQDAYELFEVLPRDEP